MAEEQSNAIDEFEREPVPRGSLLGFKSFLGMYAGEHCAGTELMIGSLFVAAGVSAFDLVFGLLLGNALAVLSWMLLCAPIATRTRLTLYCQLEKICGRNLVTVYNLANGVMFCFLAGAMITVSATAVGEWIRLRWGEFPMPGLNDLYPNSVGWVFAVLGVGTAISLVAASGYRTVARFANIAAPWMVLVFLGFGLIGLRQFITATGAEIDSAGDLWRLAKNEIWTGGDPLPGKVKFTFWHVTFFAWFCNMAMHVGMSDLTVFRYARKSWYAIATSAGMYVGHFMAWISASILYAYQLHLDPKDTDILPGPLAYKAAGIAGLICVIIAGWTTANPTIYRAGLAFQAIMPKRSRFTVTLLTGLVATVAGMFPAIAMKLLDFVMLYGMVLMPMGAVILVDHYLIRRLGLRNNYAEHSGKTFNVAAAYAWFGTFAVCITVVFLDMKSIVEWLEARNVLSLSDNGREFLVQANQIYFVSLPGWFLAAAIYIVVSAIWQRGIHETSTFRAVAASISWLALAGIVVPPIPYLLGKADLDTVKLLMLCSTILWFLATPLWMGLKRSDRATDD